MMANEEHLRMFHSGTREWNQWRKDNPGVLPDLEEISLCDPYSVGIDLHGVNLRRAMINRGTLREADLSMADLSMAWIFGTELKGAWMVGANLVNAKLHRCSLFEADLSQADLSESFMSMMVFQKTMLQGTNFDQAGLNWSIFADVDLCSARGLDSVVHYGPSTIGLDTIYKSGASIPERFLRGAGVSEEFIAYARSLVHVPIKFYSCYIAHSNRDHGFTKQLYEDLRKKDIRCWFAPEDMKIGDPIRVRIDESIRLHDKLLLVLSEHSVASSWVEQEVETALERERRNGKTVLFPIRLDDAVMEIETGWPALIRNTRHIGDFTRWMDHDAYKAAFERLLRDLKAESSE